MTITALELGWAAGFLEGEGCFAGTKLSPRVSADQKQREPLERLERLFGGNINARKTRNIYTWALAAHKSAQVMMTLYVLMSPKRQREIAARLEKWKQYPPRIPKGSAACHNGHAFTEENTYLGSRTRPYRRCRRCNADRQLAWKKKHNYQTRRI